MSALHHDEFTEQMFKQVPKGCYLRTNGISYSDDKTEREYVFWRSRDHKRMVSFRARRLPGCCGVLVVYYLRPAKEITKENLQMELFRDALDRIVEAAGLAKLGTVVLSQTRGSLGEKILTSCGGVMGKFTNWKTNNEVSLFKLNTERPPAPEPKKPGFDDEHGDY